jgi:hypothetical protein
MGLLANIDEITKPGPRELRELDRALEDHDRGIGGIECLAAVCKLAQATSCLVGIHRFPNFRLPWTTTFDLLLEQPVFAALFQGVDLAKWTPQKEKLKNDQRGWRGR